MNDENDHAAPGGERVAAPIPPRYPSAPAIPVTSPVGPPPVSHAVSRLGGDNGRVPFGADWANTPLAGREKGPGAWLRREGPRADAFLIL